MSYLATVLLGLTSLGSCQAPVPTSLLPATLPGYWECDTATSVAVDPAGQPLGDAGTSRIGA